MSKIAGISRLEPEDLGKNIPEWGYKLLSHMNNRFKEIVDNISGNLDFANNIKCDKFDFIYDAETEQVCSHGVLKPIGYLIVWSEEMIEYHKLDFFKPGQFRFYANATRSVAACPRYKIRIIILGE